VVPDGPAFFSREDFEAWRRTSSGAPIRVKYYKGLGTWSLGGRKLTIGSGMFLRNGHNAALVIDTGTLTAGVPEVGDLTHFGTRDLGIALALASASAHPLSVALRGALTQRGIAPAEVDDIREVPGYGTEGKWQGRRVRLGRAQWVGANATAATAAWLSVAGEPPVEITFTDRLRPGAEQAVAALQASGRQVILMSGDSQGAVAALADRLGIAQWLAEALPGDKAARIKALQDQGKRVLMVGDGLNDTAALTAAHASISPASALDAARVASDIVLLGTDLSPIAEAIHTAEMATRRIRQNFMLAKMYNLIAVPLAVAGLCSPLIAALAMSSSSIIVSLNALRLR
jgi:Cu2+-exporting ATPase